MGPRGPRTDACLNIQFDVAFVIYAAGAVSITGISAKMVRTGVIKGEDGGSLFQLHFPDSL